MGQQTCIWLLSPARLYILQLSIPCFVRVSQVVPGKPEAWPALVLNTVFRKPGGQVPLAGFKEPEVRDVPDPLPELPEDPDEPEVALLEPALVALLFDGGADA